MDEYKGGKVAALVGAVFTGALLVVAMGGTAMAANRPASSPAEKGAVTARAPSITNMTIHSYNGTPSPIGSGAPTSGEYDFSNVSYRILNQGAPNPILSIFGTNGSGGWTLEFRAPNGGALKPGTYNNAEEINYPPSSRPGLEGVFGPVADGGFGCGVENIGSFLIGNISMSGNVLTSFSAYARMNCQNSSGTPGYDVVRILYKSSGYLHLPDFYGYTAVTSDGSVANIGEGSLWGSAPSSLNKPIVGMALTQDQFGYWLVASDGGIFAFGDAKFQGSTGNIHLNKPIVGMAATPDGKGYWLVASDGGIFAFGDAHFYGSTGNLRLAKPVVGMTATPDGKGYLLVASDGGIFAFGDATFHGSTGNIHLSKPVVGIASTRDGAGYWMVASDGGIFAFGDASFHGSTGNIHLNKAIIGMAATPDGEGYWLLGADGGIFNFGDGPLDGGGPNTLFSTPERFVGISASTY
jgi:ribosomal protein L24E